MEDHQDGSAANQLAGFRFIFGDCLEKMSEMPERSIDMVLVDPPFGSTACAWDVVIPLEPMWMRLKRIMKEDGVVAIMANEPYTSMLVCSNIKQFKYRWTWKKNKPTGFLNAKKQPLRCMEDICIFYGPQAEYHPQKTTGHKPVHSYTKHTSDGETLGKTKIGISGGGQTDRYPTNMIDFIKVINNDGSSMDGKKVHPAQKPIALMEYMIRTHSSEGQTVLDFAMGSCTTAIACLNTGRKFIGIENDPAYFSSGKERFEKYAVTAGCS